MSLGTTIKTIQDIMRQDPGVDGDAQRISQLVWMIFLKVFDDREEERELLEDGYRSPIPQKLRWRSWAKDPTGITGEALLDFVDNELFKTLKVLPTGGKNAALAAVVRSVFEDAINHMKRGTLMRQVINKLNEVDFNRKADRHQFGEIYEQILADLQGAGNAGEYYTPRAVTQFIVDRVDPKLGEKVFDPACGTGGFLSCAIDHIRDKKKYVKTPEDNALLQQSLFGVEKKQLPHLLCVTNMILHGIDVPSRIRRDNTLARPLRDYGPKDRVQVIITNPPFGGIEEPGIEANFPQAYRTRETADLFLLLIMTLLEDGGRAALVLPDGTLFGSGVKTSLKEKLLEECDLHTIVRLPKGVFNPYTSIKTNLLFFTKGKPTKEVWFYEHPYPPGYKSYSKTKPMRFEEFEPETKWWNKRKENDHAWKVSAEEIKARGYNLDFKNPRAVKDGPGDANELLKEHHALSTKVARVRNALRDELQTTLEGRATRATSDALTSAEGPEEFATAWRRVADNFGILFDKPDSVGALRDVITALAVRGKLEGRDPKNEPVEALLTRVAAERNRQLGSGKSRRGDASPPIEDSEIAESPSHWRWERLGLLADVVGGVTKGRDLRGRNIAPYPYLRVANVQRGFLDLSLMKEIEIPTDELERYRLRRGDVLFTEGGDWDKLGRSAVWEGEIDPCLHQNHVFRARVYTSDLSPRWISLFGNSPVGRRYFEEAAKQTTNLASINMTQLRHCPVPVPPAQEQIRILKRVDQLMALCDELEARLRDAEKGAQRLAEAMTAAMVA